MSGDLEFVNSMFQMPGQPGSIGTNLLQEAAVAVEGLLEETIRADRPNTEMLSRLLTAVKQAAVSSLKCDYLTDPVLIEALHHLAASSPTLKLWHERVAAPSILSMAPRGETAERQRATSGAERIGHLLLPLMLRLDESWCGELPLQSDLFGRLRFPLCDWSVVLESPQTGSESVLGEEDVIVKLDGGRAYWSLDDSNRTLFLIQSRDDCRRMIVESDPSLTGSVELADYPPAKAVLRRAGRVGDSAVRYDPIHFSGGRQHAELSGILIERILAAIARNSPAVYDEFCRYIKSIRGFESAGGPRGTIQSFSDPTLPGVMGINICFTAADEPRLSPLCFTWFGHELGHTKFYLIDAIACARGFGFVRNGTDRTGPIARYGRPLSVRTLFQVPYVHLYEWTLLADFVRADFHTLPWSVADDPIAAGDDLEREIEESFHLIGKHARLTATGETALAHFRDLFEQARADWQSVRSR